MRSLEAGPIPSQTDGIFLDQTDIDYLAELADNFEENVVLSRAAKTELDELFTADTDPDDPPDVRAEAALKADIARTNEYLERHSGARRRLEVMAVNAAFPGESMKEDRVRMHKRLFSGDKNLTTTAEREEARDWLDSLGDLTEFLLRQGFSIKDIKGVPEEGAERFKHRQADHEFATRTWLKNMANMEGDLTSTLRHYTFGIQQRAVAELIEAGRDEIRFGGQTFVLTPHPAGFSYLSYWQPADKRGWVHFYDGNLTPQQYVTGGLSSTEDELYFLRCWLAENRTTDRF